MMIMYLHFYITVTIYTYMNFTIYVLSKGG